MYPENNKSKNSDFDTAGGNFLNGNFIVRRIVGLVVFDGEKFLLLHRVLHWKGWEFPKGHVEEGESEEATMKREIKEETGIEDLKIIPGFKKYIKYFFRQYPTKNESRVSRFAKASQDRAKRPWIFKLVVFFVAETETKEVKISPEHTEFAWLPIEEAIAKTTFKNSKKLLKEASDFVEKSSYTL